MGEQQQLNERICTRRETRSPSRTKSEECNFSKIRFLKTGSCGLMV